MTTLGAFVVLYHPTREQLAQVVKLHARCDALLAIDNSPEMAPETVALLEAHGVVWLHNANRNGIAGALNQGLTSLFACGYDAVALFDQDSLPPADYFNVMRGVATALGARPFLAGPRIYDDNEGRFLPELITNGIGVRRLQLDAGMNAQRCSFLITSGCVVSRRAFDVLGGFTESLFIDHVDTEYCLRALAREVPLYVIPNLIMPHQIGKKRRHALGPFRLTTMNHPSFRRYYSARNAMHLGLQYGLKFPVAFVPNLLTLWGIVQILLFEADKMAKLQSIGLGVADGLLGRLGPLENARPGLAAHLAYKARHG